MKDQIEKIIIIDQEGTITYKDSFTRKTIHLESLDLALNGNIAMNNQNNLHHKNNLNIYLPIEITDEQLTYLEYINKTINNYGHIAIHYNIQKDNEVYKSQVMSTYIKNFDISNNFVNKKTKKK